MAKKLFTPLEASERYKSQRERLHNRPDFRVGQQPILNNSASNADSHHTKMQRYKSQIEQLLNDCQCDAIIVTEWLSRASMLISSLEDNSAIALFSDLKQFTTYCKDNGFKPLPIQGNVLDGYLSFLVSKNRKRATIDRHINSLAAWHEHLELDDPRKTFKIKQRIKTVRKISRSNPKQAKGLRAINLQVAYERLSPDVPRDCADIALLFVAFYTLCRKSELVGFDWEDFEKDEEDGSSLLALNQSKTNKEEVEYRYLSPAATSILLHWKKVSGIESGAIFRGITSSGEITSRLSVKGVDRAYKRIAKQLGFDAALFSGHSSRVGGAQEMLERDIDSAKIMLAGGWKSIRMVVKYAKKIDAKKGAAALLSRELENNTGQISTID
jgi:integrase